MTDHDDPHATYLQYVGVPDSTADCVEAVERLLLTNAEVRSALIVTSRKTSILDHALLLTISEGDEVIIKSGFTSGYLGQGPRGFSRVLHLLHWHGVELDEVDVDGALMDRLDASALTSDDLSSLKSTRRVLPRRFWDYIHASDAELHGRNPWAGTEPHVPMAIIDDRLAAAARDFWSDPDGTLLKGHRQLEEAIRDKASISIEEAVKGPGATYSLAFNGNPPRLAWPGISNSEHTGRASLFIGALKAYRHVRAHRAHQGSRADQLCELLVLNQLFRLEAQATVTAKESNKGKTALPTTPS